MGHTARNQESSVKRSESPLYRRSGESMQYSVKSGSSPVILSHGVISYSPCASKSHQKEAAVNSHLSVDICPIPSWSTKTPSFHHYLSPTTKSISFTDCRSSHIFMTSKKLGSSKSSGS